MNRAQLPKHDSYDMLRVRRSLSVRSYPLLRGDRMFPICQRPGKRHISRIFSVGNANAFMGTMGVSCL